MVAAGYSGDELPQRNISGSRSVTTEEKVAAPLCVTYPCVVRQHRAGTEAFIGNGIFPGETEQGAAIEISFPPALDDGLDVLRDRNCIPAVLRFQLPGIKMSFKGRCLDHESVAPSKTSIASRTSHWCALHRTGQHS